MTDEADYEQTTIPSAHCSPGDAACRILIQTMIYAWLWFSIYYPLVRLRLKFYLNGHILVLLLYFILLLFLTKTYGGMDVGYQKPFDVSLSQIFSLLIVNAFTYLPDSLMRNWILPLGWALLVTLVQILFAVLWIQISDKVYHKVFPPTKMILIYGERNAEPILQKFASRPEKYDITKTICISEGVPAIKRAILESGKMAVVLWDIPTLERNDLMKFCYAKA